MVREAFLPGGANKYLYDLVSSGEGAPSLRFVGVNNHNQGEVIGNSNCGQELGAGPLGDISGLEVDGKNSKSNAIAAGGGEIFFTTHVLGSAKCGLPDGNQLFVRVGGSRTLEVSRPLESSQPFGGCGDGGNAGEVPGEVPCPGAASRAPAEFDGASEDGSRVFFTTTAPLVGSDTSNNLYMATIGCPAGAGAACAAAGEAANTKVESLVQVSHDPNVGEAADVQGTVGLGPAAMARVSISSRGGCSRVPRARARRATARMVKRSAPARSRSRARTTCTCSTRKHKQRRSSPISAPARGFRASCPTMLARSISNRRSVR